jgi:hypothetical protein
MRLRSIIAALNPFGPASGDWHSIDARAMGSLPDRAETRSGSVERSEIEPGAGTARAQKPQQDEPHDKG